jgi:hypothetical protein
VGERCGEADQSGLVVDRSGLDGRDLVAAQRLAYDVEAARQRRIAIGLILIARVRGADGGDERLFRIGQFRLRLGEGCGDAPMVSLDRCMGALPIQIEADSPRLRPFGPHPVAKCFLGVLGHQCFEFGFGSLMVEKRGAGRAEEVSELAAGIGPAHVDDSNSLNARPRRLDPIRARRLPDLDALRSVECKSPRKLPAGEPYSPVTAALAATQEPFSALAARRLSSSSFIVLTQFGFVTMFFLLIPALSAVITVPLSWRMIYAL